MNRVKVILLLTSTLTVMSGATIGPVLPLIGDVFADTPHSELLSRLVLTMPALLIVLFSPLCGYLTDRYGRKKLLVTGVLIYGLTGSAGLWLNDLHILLISRAILGLSVAIIMTICVTLIGDYYCGRERQKMMGTQSAFMAFGGVVFISLSGFLGDFSWRAPFFIYTSALFLLPGLILLITEPEHIESGSASYLSRRPRPISRLTVLATLLASFSGMALFYLIPVHIPFLLSEYSGMSNTGIGVALASFVLMGAITALRYDYFVRRMAYFDIYLLSFFLMGTGFVFVALSNSYAQIFAGMITGGVGSGLLMPNTNVWLLSEAPEHLRGRYSSLITTAVFLGQFLSPIISQPIVKTMNIQGTFCLAGILMIVITLGILLKSKISGKVFS